MNNINSSALFRSLVVYAVCVPLAIVVGYAIVNLTNYRDYQSLGFIGVLLAVLIFPLLMKWHYPLLVFSLAAPISLFFLPGRPNLFMGMVVVSLGISVVERILNKERHFLQSSTVRWPLLALLAVVVFTAEMTGGFGLRSMGSDVYGGKKYVTLTIGILSFFALTARPIPKKQANLYITLYFIGSALCFISDLYSLVPTPLQFIYLVIPPDVTGLDEMGGYQLTLGETRFHGIGFAAGSIFYWMLARHGIRDMFQVGKPWRPLVLVVSFLMIFLGGYRSAIIGAMIIFGLIFFMEKLHRTPIMPVFVMLAILGGTLLVPLASHLPYTFQRSLAWLPLDIRQDVRVDAEGSSEWRLNIWKALLPTVPKYLLLGKGYAFSAQTFDQSMGNDATFRGSVMDASQNPLALSSDFHSGPLSIVIPFGIWGVLACLWFFWAAFRVLWLNYHHGDPVVRHINLFLFALFLSKLVTFLFIAGSIVEDIGGFASTVALSLAMNRGVLRPQAQPQTSPAAANPRFAIPARPAFQR